MTVQSRGSRTRRGDRGPGWPALTALLVLAILASATLVFTNRVELLRLAVILALWAAVVAAFVTVIYRRQSELDQARARDMKFVYDLQLDREISARREYELAVESHLRRQLAREVRAEASDEMAALRAELTSLRSQLSVMLGTDLNERPALESERIVVPMPIAPDRVESSRVVTMVTEEFVEITEVTEAIVESPIIDVPEEPLVPQAPPAPPPTEPRYPPRDYHRGSHRRPADGKEVRKSGPVEPVVVSAPPPPPVAPAPPPQPEAPWRPPEVRRARHSTGDAGRQSQRPETASAPEAPRGRHWVGPADNGSGTNGAESTAEQPGFTGRHRGSQQVDGEPAPEASPEQLAESQGQHTGGQSVADLMARLQVNGPAGGGGRRRRED
ncbi:MAG: DUF6779 domain-containing protein [Mycobacterium sp.]